MACHALHTSPLLFPALLTITSRNMFAHSRFTAVTLLGAAAASVASSTASCMPRSCQVPRFRRLLSADVLPNSPEYGYAYRRLWTARVCLV